MSYTTIPRPTTKWEVAGHFAEFTKCILSSMILYIEEAAARHGKEIMMPVETSSEVINQSYLGMVEKGRDASGLCPQRKARL